MLTQHTSPIKTAFHRQVQSSFNKQGKFAFKYPGQLQPLGSAGNGPSKAADADSKIL